MTSAETSETVDNHCLPCREKHQERLCGSQGGLEDVSVLFKLLNVYNLKMRLSGVFKPKQNVCLTDLN